MSIAADWYALAVKPQHEKTAARALASAGLEEFLPLYHSRRRWSDRIKELELPLFSGYVFCRFRLEDRWRTLMTPGVVGIVSFGGRPAPVSKEEISAVRRMTDSRQGLEPWPYLRAGQRVRIERGPLSGLDGVLVRSKDYWRVVVSVELLQRSVAVEVDREALWLLPDGPVASCLPPTARYARAV